MKCCECNNQMTEKKFYDTDARFPDATHAGQGAHLVGRRQPDAGMDRLSRSRCHPALLHGQAGGLAPDLEHRLRDHQSGGFFLPNSNSWYCHPEAYVTNIFTAVIYAVPKWLHCASQLILLPSSAVNCSYYCHPVQPWPNVMKLVLPVI